MSHLILSLSLFSILTLPFAVHAAGETSASAKPIEGCEGFTSEQLDKDPNAPCFAAIRMDLNEKDSAGVYYDSQLVSNPRDEVGGGHVQTGLVPADDTNNNKYEIPYSKSALPPSGSGGQQHGGSESGTD